MVVSCKINNVLSLISVVLILKLVFCSCDITSGGVYSGVWEGGQHAPVWRTSRTGSLVYRYWSSLPQCSSIFSQENLRMFQHVNKPSCISAVCVSHLQTFYSETRSSKVKLTIS